MKSLKTAAVQVLSVLVVISLLFVSSVSVTASAESELDKAKKAYSQAKREYDKLKNEKASAEDQLEAAQNAYFSLVSQVELINKNIDHVQGEIEKLQGQIADYQVKIEKQQKRMDKKYSDFCARLKSLYIAGSMSSLQVLMTSKDFSEYLTRLEMVKKIGEMDADAIKELEDILHELQELKKQLDVDRAEQQAKKNELSDQKAELEARKSEAATSLAECESLIAQIKEAQADAQAEMQKVLAQINKMVASGGIKGTGQLCYPVPSCTNVSCGFYGYANHNGVDFANGPGLYGAPVVASDDGQVVGVDMWEYSYGHHVTIDHGNGIKTMYCHMSNIDVSVGQNVTKGQVIGGVGCTGNVIPRGMGGTHLHFGVVVNGGFVNPFDYL
ncbi:MAG: peptidoglycan DD-metalloendopeptidase family protein [Clostridia bacterium]|nr:peptidoglycan DD-metalloendopeptidase family protein [Clostridia bacterium]